MAAHNDCSHFIAVWTTDLVRLLGADSEIAREDHARLGELAHLLQQVYHQYVHRRLSELKNAYAPFDPDSDAVSIRTIKADEKQRLLNDLLSELNWLLDRAHFRHLSREDIEPMLESSSDWGIRMEVDFSAFDHCAIFVRGEAFEKRLLRAWRTFFRQEEVEVPIFRRLVLILKLRPNPKLGRTVETDHVYLKLFKDIPRPDVDMLLPGAKVRLKLLDRSKIGFGLITGLATMAWRMIDDLLKFVHHFILTDGAIWGLTAGCLGYGYKSYYDYRTTQQAYHLSLTQSLYFQNLDSNAGVLTRLFDEAEEQETRTTLLAYYCLWRYSGTNGFTSEELQAALELFLDRYADVSILCEPGEPACKLIRLRLARMEGDRYYPIPLIEAIDLLKKTANSQSKSSP
jgi:hypothetical protein